jgi:hypothetical protein
LELSFEYLMASGELHWVTIISSQAILMSLCLQSMVEELLRMRNGVAIKKAGEKSCTMQFSFKRKDGSEMIIPIRSGLHSVSSAFKVHFYGEYTFITPNQFYMFYRTETKIALPISL